MTIRVVLAPGVTRVDFQNLAMRMGWALVELVEPDGERPYEEIWRGGEGAVHYIEDDRLGVAYVLAMGQETELAVSVAEALNTIGPAEAAAWLSVAITEEQRVSAVAYLAASAPAAPTDETVAAFKAALGDHLPAVRRAALFAAAYVAWPELDAEVEQIAVGDPQPLLREAAGRTLAAIRQHRQS